MAGNDRGEPWLFLNVDEADFIAAAVDTLIPADEVGPGGLETGVPTYIDRQLAGAFGAGARLYLQGPFAEGTPQQGYQLPLTPAELIRAGIADARAWCRATYGSDLPALPASERAAAMTACQAGTASFATVPSRAFFALLLQLTHEGYFADPIHGGNRDMAAWKMLGFPGAGGRYADAIEPYRNRPYPAQPRSIGDA